MSGTNGRQDGSGGIAALTDEQLQLEKEKLQAEIAALAREAYDEFGPWLPLAKLMELEGDPGVGKTWGLSLHAVLYPPLELVREPESGSTDFTKHGPEAS